jgi:8-oxo-dGTP pyrophosphatase MutT (NUDIX family)
MVKVKKSYGIICCRQDPSLGFQAILIKKPVTYHFCEFVAGHYRKNDEVHLKKLFNNMSYHEKADILSLKFNNMWYRIYKTNPDQTFLQSNGSFMSKQYYRKKTKFEVSFLHDGGAKLRSLLADSINAETLWEIPKGRKREHGSTGKSIEDDLDAAIREFSEETAIPPSGYKILWHIKPYIETYSDFGTTYQNIFYYAEAAPNLNPTIKFSNLGQISEVSAIMWCSINDLAHMSLESNTYRRLLNMFKKVSTKYKNSKKNTLVLLCF